MRIGKQQYELLRALAVAPLDHEWTTAEKRVLAGLVERGLARHRNECYALTGDGQEALLVLLLREAAATARRPRRG